MKTTKNACCALFAVLPGSTTQLAADYHVALSGKDDAVQFICRENTHDSHFFCRISFSRIIRHSGPFPTVEQER
jgi:hypothetical protein